MEIPLGNLENKLCSPQLVERFVLVKLDLELEEVRPPLS